jgi:predicted rRNA methylase YqxC with S4 and FtsJ domains
VHERVLGEIAAQVPEWGAKLEGIADSGLPGPKGNREFFIHLVAAG